MAQGAVIAKRLKEARQRAGLSQKRLGVLAGIDEFSASPRMNQYERGKHVPNPSVVQRLAWALGVPPPYFYAEDDALAALILAIDRLSPTLKRKLLKQLMGERRFK
jgi:transcriptional regulator with XRE-family HTH domain